MKLFVVAICSQFKISNIKMSVYWFSNALPGQDIYWSNLSPRICLSHFSTNIAPNFAWMGVISADGRDLITLMTLSSLMATAQCGLESTNADWCALMYRAIRHKIPFCSISKGNKSILLISNNSEMGSGHCEPAPLGLISGFPSHHNDACWIPLRSSRCKHNWFLMDYSSALMPAADLKEWFSIGVLSSECQRTASHPDQIWQEARGRLAGRGGKRSHNSGAWKLKMHWRPIVNWSLLEMCPWK